MSGFRYRKNLDGGSAAPTVMEAVGKNSIVFQIGDLIRINTSGFVDVVDATEGIAGVVVGVVDSKGIRIDPDSGTLDTYTMASDNQTVAGKKVQFIPALPNYLFYNDSDDTLATTNLLQYFDTNDENDVDVATATDTATAQVRLVALDPDGDANASKGLFQIVKSQFGSIAVSGAA